MVPFNESTEPVYKTLIGIAERIIRTAEEKVGAPVKILSTEPLTAGAYIGSELIIYDFEQNQIRRGVHGGQKTA